MLETETHDNSARLPRLSIQLSMCCLKLTCRRVREVRHVPRLGLLEVVDEAKARPSAKDLELSSRHLLQATCGVKTRPRRRGVRLGGRAELGDPC
jgi:hypothetical protein